MASVDFSCPAESVTVEKLGGVGWGAGTNALARGCGQQARYVRSGTSGWVLNSPVSQVGGPPPPPASEESSSPFGSQ